MDLFRDLDEDEEKEFVQWADHHKDEAEADHTIHPVILARWVELGLITAESSRIPLQLSQLNVSKVEVFTKKCEDWRTSVTFSHEGVEVAHGNYNSDGNYESYSEKTCYGVVKGKKFNRYVEALRENGKYEEAQRFIDNGFAEFVDDIEFVPAPKWVLPKTIDFSAVDQSMIEYEHSDL
jgi:hypothetical protein